MSERLADQLDSVWAEAAGVFSDAFHTDRYELIRTVSRGDGYGGYETVEAVVESGACALEVDLAKGGERQVDTMLMTVTLYSVELPKESLVTTDDTMRVNGRTFDILDVKRGGDWAMFADVALQEVL